MKKSFLILILLFIFSFSIWRIIYTGYGDITTYSFWLDDWPLIWGSSQQDSVFYNPAKIRWNFEDERFAIREGFLQIWITTILYKLYGLNPYFYHMFGLFAKFIASLCLAWAGWKISKKLYIGIITGLIFAASALGTDSLYWYNCNGVYLVIAIIALALPFFINGIQGNKKHLIISLILTSLGIYLYPPRAHAFLALPILAVIWSKKILNIKLWISILIIFIIMFISYKLPAGGAAESQAYNAVLHRLIVFGGNGLKDNNHMFLTYPIVSLSLSIFPESFLVKLINSPHSQLFTQTTPIRSRFYTWNFLIFPFTWMLLLGFNYLVLKINKQKIMQKEFFIWTFLGFVVLISNELLRRYFLESRHWSWDTHFLFSLSLIGILFSFACLYFFRGLQYWATFSKILLSSLILIIISYIFNWAFDPLIHPAELNIGRYLTLPVAFGSLFMATLIGMTIFLCLQTYTLKRKDKSLSSRLLQQPGLLLIIIFLCVAVYKIIAVNLVTGKTIVERLKPIRSQENVGRILNTISTDIMKGPKPAIVLLDTWSYSDVFAILLYTGHSLAVWNKIYDPREFPRIYYDENKLLSEFPNLCTMFKLEKDNFYRYKVEIDKAINISDQFPEISCETIQKPL